MKNVLTLAPFVDRLIRNLTFNKLDISLSIDVLQSETLALLDQDLTFHRQEHAWIFR